MRQWGIVALFGHVEFAGFIEPDPDFPTMIRISIPESDTIPAWTKIVGPAAVYSIDPVTEETARLKAHSLKAAPANLYDVRTHVSRLMAANAEKIPVQHDEDHPGRWNDESDDFDERDFDED